MRGSRTIGMRRVVAAAAAGLVAVGAGLLGGGSQATAAEDDEPLIFRVGMLQKVDSLNPYKGYSAAAYELWALSYEGLLGYSAADFSPEPRLAESWEVSEDGLTWTYNIRQGVTFSDGTPLTSEDVVYSINRVREGRLEGNNWDYQVAQVTDVEATDEHTVVITLKKATPLMTRLWLPIVPKHLWEQVSEDEVRKYSNAPDADPPGFVGTGPFVLTQVREGEFWTFEANPDYWGGAPNIDGVEFRLFRNADAMAQALRNGEIDFADDIDANIFKSLEGVENIETRASDYYGWNYITYNRGAILTDGTPVGDGHPSLADPVVRRAIHMAVDKDVLVDRLFGGYGTPGTTVIPPLYNEHLEPADPVVFDLAAANAMLDEAGYAKGDDGIRTMPDGTNPLKYRLFARSTSETSQQTIRLLQGWLKEIGIDSTVQVVDEDRLYEIAGEGTFELYEWGWVPEPDPDSMMSNFTCDQLSYEWGGTIWAGYNDSFYCNDEYEELYKQQAVELDVEARTEIVQQMQQMLYDDDAYIVTAYYDYLQAYRSDRFEGFVPQPDPDGAILFQYGIYSYLNIDAPAEEAGGDGESSNTPMLIAGALGVVGVVALVAWLASRGRRSDTADTE